MATASAAASALAGSPQGLTRHAQPAAATGGVPASGSVVPESARPPSLAPPSPGPPSGVPLSVAPESGAGAQLVTSAGHVAATPSHTSSGSQLVSVDARHEMPVETSPSGGHVAEPVQSSALSQGPLDGRHSTPSRNSATQSAVVPAQ